MATDPNYQKDYYQKNRQKRIDEACAWQREHQEHRKAYLASWHKRNADKVAEYRKRTADKRNARRRELYALQPDVREKKIAEAKAYRLKNPDTRLKRRLAVFGLTIEEYYEKAASGCAICGRLQNKDHRRFKQFHLDHCHDTGEFRGVLCSSCNLGLGKFQDDAGLLQRAADYLRSHDRDRIRGIE